MARRGAQRSIRSDLAWPTCRHCWRIASSGRPMRPGRNSSGRGRLRRRRAPAQASKPQLPAPPPAPRDATPEPAPALAAIVSGESATGAARSTPGGAAQGRGAGAHRAGCPLGPAAGAGCSRAARERTAGAGDATSRGRRRGDPQRGRGVCARARNERSGPLPIRQTKHGGRRGNGAFEQGFRAVASQQVTITILSLEQRGDAGVGPAQAPGHHRRRWAEAGGRQPTDHHAGQDQRTLGHRRNRAVGSRWRTLEHEGAGRHATVCLLGLGGKRRSARAVQPRGSRHESGDPVHRPLRPARPRPGQRSDTAGRAAALRAFQQRFSVQLQPVQHGASWASW